MAPEKSRAQPRFLRFAFRVAALAAVTSVMGPHAQTTARLHEGAFVENLSTIFLMSGLPYTIFGAVRATSSLSTSDRSGVSFVTTTHGIFHPLVIHDTIRAMRAGAARMGKARAYKEKVKNEPFCQLSAARRKDLVPRTTTMETTVASNPEVVAGAGAAAALPS